MVKVTRHDIHLDYFIFAMYTKKVSGIVPVYNTSVELIERALGSLIKQSYQNIEIIVVDDGSTKESTISYLKSINDHKLKLISKQNG